LAARLHLGPPAAILDAFQEGLSGEMIAGDLIRAKVEVRELRFWCGNQEGLRHRNDFGGLAAGQIGV